MKKLKLILVRAPLLPFHAIAEALLLCASVFLVAFVAILTRSIDLAERWPDMCWYKGGEYQNMRKKINNKIKSRLKEKDCR
jgi:hypothetical protein